MNTLHREWLGHLAHLKYHGRAIGPRGQMTLELLDHDVLKKRDSTFNLLDVEERKLNYRFAVAEWLWMMFGHSDVDTIAQYNGVMRNYSDDGMWLTGAYGPPIFGARFRVLRQLTDDPETRQAVIVIPRPNMPKTKDEPCTTSLQFLLRDGKLNLIVNMRSSDAWLGVPYDTYTFTMIQNCFAAVLGVQRGWFSMHAGSAHLYDRDFDAAMACIGGSGRAQTLRTPQLPSLPPDWLEEVLVYRDAKRIPPMMNSSPWLPYAQVLLSKTSEEARNILVDLAS